jgi:rubrerythrin
MAREEEEEDEIKLADGSYISRERLWDLKSQIEDKELGENITALYDGFKKSIAEKEEMVEMVDRLNDSITVLEAKETQFADAQEEIVALKKHVSALVGYVFESIVRLKQSPEKSGVLMKPNDWKILRWSHNQHKPVTFTEIADGLGWSNNAVNTRLRALRFLGFMQKLCKACSFQFSLADKECPSCHNLDGFYSVSEQGQQALRSYDEVS